MVQCLQHKWPAPQLHSFGPGESLSTPVPMPKPCRTEHRLASSIKNRCHFVSSGSAAEALLSRWADGLRFAAQEDALGAPGLSCLASPPPRASRARVLRAGGRGRGRGAAEAVAGLCPGDRHAPGQRLDVRLGSLDGLLGGSQPSGSLDFWPFSV